MGRAVSYKIPDTRIRDVQFDSFFMECVMRAKPEKRDMLSVEERHWLYNDKEDFLLKYCEKASMDNKFAVLVKLGYHFSNVVYDDNNGADLERWIKAIRISKGKTYQPNWLDGSYVQMQGTFINGSHELNRILARMEVMYHSKLYPVSKYITRIRNYKRLANYENLLKQHDFIHFILKCLTAYDKFIVYGVELGKKPLDKWLILILMYMENRVLTTSQIKQLMGERTSSSKVYMALEELSKQGLVDKTRMSGHVYKNHILHMITDKGNEIVLDLCRRILKSV